MKKLGQVREGFRPGSVYGAMSPTGRVPAAQDGSICRASFARLWRSLEGPAKEPAAASLGQTKPAMRTGWSRKAALGSKATQ